MENDVNGDGNLDALDGVDSAHMDIILATCDVDGNASIDLCELYDCVVASENEYR